MGANNRITKEKFNKIKKDCKLPADDPFVIEKYGIGQSTVRNIRNSADYQEYCERVFRYHGHPAGRGGSMITKTPQQPVKMLEKGKNGQDIADIIAILAPWVFALLVLVICCILAGGSK